MEKFKVGDKVRCIDSKGTYSLTKGNEYIVKGFDSYGRIIVNGSICSWHPDRFELVEEKQEEETVSEVTNKFKVGDKVRCIDSIGSNYLIKGNEYLVDVVDYYGDIMVKGEDQFWYSGRFELVEEELEEETVSDYINNFKVGDSVRCVDTTNTHFLTREKIYTVMGVNKSNCVSVDVGKFYWEPSRFELVEEEEFEEVSMTEFKRFGDMSLEEKEELISAYLRGEEILYSTSKTGDAKVLGTYASKGTVLFTHIHYYKIKKEELDIPWDYIDSKYKYAFKGMGDIVLVSTHKPKYDKLTEYWSVPEGTLRNLPDPFVFKNLDKIKPEESVVERPNNE